MMPSPAGASAVGTNPNTQALQSMLIGLQDPYLAQYFAPGVKDILTGPGQKAASANSALQGAESAFNLAGGGQGLLGGLLAKLGGAVTGGPTATYDQAKQQLQAQLLALGIPASAIPDITNTAPAAQSQWSTLQNLINSMGVGGGGTLAGLPV